MPSHSEQLPFFQTKLQNRSNFTDQTAHTIWLTNVFSSDWAVLWYHDCSINWWRVVIMTHQNLRLGKCWKLFWATLKQQSKQVTHSNTNPIFCPTAILCWWGITRPKQLSMAAIAQVIWRRACVRYWPGRGLVFERHLLILLLNHEKKLPAIYCNKQICSTAISFKLPRPAYCRPRVNLFRFILLLNG